MKKLLLLLSIGCYSLVISPGANCQNAYANKTSKQKLVTQLKAAIEAAATNFVAYKGAEMKEINSEEDFEGVNVYTVKKPFRLATFAAVTCLKEQKKNEIYLEFDGFDSDEDAVAFGENLQSSLKSLSYTFGKFTGVATGADGILELDVNKSAAKSYKGLRILINVPDETDNLWHNKVTMRIFKLGE